MKVSTSESENGVIVLQVEGQVDAHTARQLSTTLNDLLDQGHSRLLIDATLMPYISSAGLRAVLAAQRGAVRVGGEVRLFGPNDQVRRILEMTGFDELLRIGDTPQEAMEGW